MELYHAFTQNHSDTEWFNCNPTSILNLLTDETINQIHNSNVHLFNVTLCETPFDFLAFELREFFVKDINIKCCANCGQFFIPTGRYNTDCCDRIPEGQKYTCKKIMAQKRRCKKANSNPIIKEYERAYKRNYARVSNGNMTSENFRLWVEKTTKKRDDFIAKYHTTPSNQLITEFKNYLGNK